MELPLQMHIRDGSRNIGIIEKNLNELETKLQYENGKMQGYSADLEQAEKKWAPNLLLEILESPCSALQKCDKQIPDSW